MNRQKCFILLLGVLALSTYSLSVNADKNDFPCPPATDFRFQHQEGTNAWTVTVIIPAWGDEHRIGQAFAYGIPKLSLIKPAKIDKRLAGNSRIFQLECVYKIENSVKRDVPELHVKSQYVQFQHCELNADQSGMRCFEAPQ
ncbi:MAG: hypothetical protein BGO67_07275 [Alphaproteobacteria bacterium 41-28]|nr:MAG: hypothetical protein BGO67_07275 [Alphaproteobacteria bacterium 41-28]